MAGDDVFGPVIPAGDRLIIASGSLNRQPLEPHFLYRARKKTLSMLACRFQTAPLSSAARAARAARTVAVAVPAERYGSRITTTKVFHDVHAVDLAR